MKFILVIIVLYIRISFCSGTLVDVECDEVQRSSGYAGPFCTLSDLDYTNDGFEYNFKSRSIWEQYTYSYKINLLTITYVEFKQCQTPEIPRQLFQKFEKLESLKMENSGVEELHRFTFEHAKNLITLNLARNNVTKLEKGTFTGAGSLTSIDLSGNNIEEIDEKAFIELPNLKTLILSSNKITSISDKTFDFIKNLRKVSLDNNELEQLSGKIFLGNQQIQEIDLNGNKISEFDLVLFDNMPNILKFVDLSYNMLVSFSMQCQTFSYKYDFPEYLYLNLSNNFLNELGISTNFSITHLYLGNNNVTSMDRVSKLNNLIELDLSFNKLGRLEMTSLSNLTHLSYLNLESTGITNIEYGTFSHQTRLITLDIAYNQLKEIDFSMFASLSELQSLYIDGNNLTSLDFIQLFDTFPKLGVIGMQDNQFNCTLLAKVISELTRRDIRIDIVEGARVTDRSNIKGVECSKGGKDQPVIWHKPIHHIHNTTDDHKHLGEKVNHLIDIVRALNATTFENTKLKTDLKDMKNRLVELTSNFYEVKSSLIAHQLSSIINGSASNALDSKEIKNMIEIMNNMTLDRQKLALDKVKQQLVELEFDVRKNSDKIGDASRMVAVQKDQIQQSPVVAVADSGVDATMKMMIVVIFLILTGFVMIKVVAYVRGSGRFQGNFRRRSNTQTTLHSTIEHSI